MRKIAVSHGLINDMAAAQQADQSQRSTPRLAPRQAQCPRPPRFLPVPLAIAMASSPPPRRPVLQAEAELLGSGGVVSESREEAAEK